MQTQRMGAMPQKTLAIQFKYLGDAVFITPALRALKQNQPEGNLHVLVAAEVAPLLEHLPWITKVWSLPRTRGRARIGDSWPIIRALRRERFDRSVDFGGNDRGAILSKLSGARQRLASVDRASLLFKICYSRQIMTATLPLGWVQRHLQLLSAWQIPPPQSTRLEIAVDPTLAEAAAQLLPAGMIVCHLGTSQPRKEWPLDRWREFYRLARAAGFALAFSSGTSERERTLLVDLEKMEPDIFSLPPVPSLKLFLAVLRRARAVVAGDTGPLHFAAGLGVPVVGLFGAEDSLLRAAPIYSESQLVKNEEPVANGAVSGTVIDINQSCLERVSPVRVLAALAKAVTGR
jgi:ADP-heptose:LPS heptosyltransferase